MLSRRRIDYRLYEALRSASGGILSGRDPRPPPWFVERKIAPHGRVNHVGAVRLASDGAETAELRRDKPTTVTMRGSCRGEEVNLAARNNRNARACACKGKKAPCDSRLAECLVMTKPVFQHSQKKLLIVGHAPDIGVFARRSRTSG
jgi:hypothetical protein